MFICKPKLATKGTIIQFSLVYYLLSNIRKVHLNSTRIVKLQVYVF